MLKDENPQVIIAGAGPVGMVSALALSRQGIRVTVLEAEDDLVIDQRAGSIQPTTLEMLASLGLEQDFLTRGLKAPIYHFRDRTTGEVVAAFDFDLLKSDTPYPFVMQYEQYKLTQDIYRKHAAAGDFTVLFSHPVASVTQTADSVTVETNGPEGAKTFTGGYLIGADGSHSVVRKSLAISFEGFTYPERFVKVATHFDFHAAYPDLCLRTYFSDPDEWCNLFKVKGDNEEGIWRAVFPSRPGETEEQALSEEGLEHRLQRFFPKAGRYEVENCAIYNVSQRVAGRFVEGRVLLAGDAAHVNNPIGGLGLNSGVHDAMNLCDKLGQVIRGEADAELLQRYDRQRRQTALNYVQEQTIRNKKMLEETDPAARRANFDGLRRTAEDRAMAREYLRRSSLFDSLLAAEAIA